MKLHYLENSQAIRIVWLLEELELDYEVIVYKRDSFTKLAPQNYKKLHPVGTSPILEIDGVCLPETNAIIDYLLMKYPNKLKPKADTNEYFKYLFWFHSTQGTLMPMLTMSFVFYTIVQKVPFFLKPIIKKISGEIHKLMITPRVEGLLSVMEIDLGKSNFICGDYLTAADINLSYTLEVAQTRFGLTSYPKVKSYLDRIMNHGKYLRAKEKVGGFTTKI